jgi:hypothetical protein
MRSDDLRRERLTALADMRTAKADAAQARAAGDDAALRAATRRLAEAQARYKAAS